MRPLRDMYTMSRSVIEVKPQAVNPDKVYTPLRIPNESLSSLAAKLSQERSILYWAKHHKMGLLCSLLRCLYYFSSYLEDKHILFKVLIDLCMHTKYSNNICCSLRQASHIFLRHFYSLTHSYAIIFYQLCAYYATSWWVNVLTSMC